MPLKGLDPGQLDRRVTIQTRTTSADAYGTPVETWTDVTTVACLVEYPKTGSGEQYFEAVPIATTATVFTIRYRSVNAATNRLKYENQIYDIERIAELGRRNHTQITAKLRQNDGR